MQDSTEPSTPFLWGFEDQRGSSQRLGAQITLSPFLTHLANLFQGCWWLQDHRPPPATGSCDSCACPAQPANRLCPAANSPALQISDGKLGGRFWRSPASTSGQVTAIGTAELCSDWPATPVVSRQQIHWPCHFWMANQMDRPIGWYHY